MSSGEPGVRGERWLLRLGEFLVRTASRRLPRRIRDGRYREWAAELPVILHDPDGGRWPQRAARMLSYALDTIRGTMVGPRPAPYRGVHSGEAESVWLPILAWTAVLLILLLIPVVPGLLVYFAITGSTSLKFQALAWFLNGMNLDGLAKSRRRRAAGLWSNPSLWTSVAAMLIATGFIALTAASDSHRWAGQLHVAALASSATGVASIVCFSSGLLTVVWLLIQRWAARRGAERPTGSGLR